MEVYHWLVNTGGLWYSVVGWGVGWILAPLPAWHFWRKHHKAQQETISQLKELNRGQRDLLRFRGDEGQPRG